MDTLAPSSTSSSMSSSSATSSSSITSSSSSFWTSNSSKAKVPGSNYSSGGGQTNRQQPSQHPGPQLSKIKHEIKLPSKSGPKSSKTGNDFEFQIIFYHAKGSSPIHSTDRIPFDGTPHQFLMDPSILEALNMSPHVCICGKRYHNESNLIAHFGSNCGLKIKDRFSYGSPDISNGCKICDTFFHTMLFSELVAHVNTCYVNYINELAESSSGEEEEEDCPGGTRVSVPLGLENYMELPAEERFYCTPIALRPAIVQLKRIKAKRFHDYWKKLRARSSPIQINPQIPLKMDTCPTKMFKMSPLKPRVLLPTRRSQSLDVNGVPGLFLHTFEPSRVLQSSPREVNDGKGGLEGVKDDSRRILEENKTLRRDRDRLLLELGIKRVEKVAVNAVRPLMRAAPEAEEALGNADLPIPEATGSGDEEEEEEEVEEVVENVHDRFKALLAMGPEELHEKFWRHRAPDHFFDEPKRCKCGEYFLTRKMWNLHNCDEDYFL